MLPAGTRDKDKAGTIMGLSACVTVHIEPFRRPVTLLNTLYFLVVTISANLLGSLVSLSR